MTLRDTLFSLEMDLAKYPGDSESDALNRRTVLRRAFEEWGNQRYREGYLDGKGDIQDARLEAHQRAEARKAAGEQP